MVENKESKSLFDREDLKKTGKNEKKHSPSGGQWWKGVIVLALLLGIVGVIFAKGGCLESGRGDKDGKFVSSKEILEANFPPETVIATVNGDSITVGDVEKTLSELPPQYRAEFEKQKHEFLEEIITRELLLQKALENNVQETELYRQIDSSHAPHPGHEEHVLIDVLLQTEVMSEVEVSEEEIRSFYEQYKDQIPGDATYEQVKAMIEPSVRQQKSFDAMMTYIEGLRNEAVITRNEEWINLQKSILADNPLDKALADELPVLADFGQSACIPCKMMKPILDELAKELEGRVHVLIIDTSDYGYLARRYGIRIIPSQIFFDSEAKEVYRHEGFMSREALLSALRTHKLLN